MAWAQDTIPIAPPPPRTPALQPPPHTAPPRPASRRPHTAARLGYSKQTYRKEGARLLARQRCHERLWGFGGGLAEEEGHGGRGGERGEGGGGGRQRGGVGRGSDTGQPHTRGLRVVAGGARRAGVSGGTWGTRGVGDGGAPPATHGGGGGAWAGGAGWGEGGQPGRRRRPPGCGCGCRSRHCPGAGRHPGWAAQLALTVPSAPLWGAVAVGFSHWGRAAGGGEGGGVGWWWPLAGAPIDRAHFEGSRRTIIVFFSCVDRRGRHVAHDFPFFQQLPPETAPGRGCRPQQMEGTQQRPWPAAARWGRGRRVKERERGCVGIKGG